MTTEEMRELDFWIAENVFKGEYGTLGLPLYSRDSKEAMDVLKKCAELQQIGLEIDTRSGIAEVYTTVDPDGDLTKAEAPTLELAICLFAKQLFSKK